VRAVSRTWWGCVGVVCLWHAQSAGAVPKAYDSSAANGTPHRLFEFIAQVCPPLFEAPDELTGGARLLDDGAGTVTLDEWRLYRDLQIDLGPDFLTTTLGPGAFIFIEEHSTLALIAPHESLSGSSLAPGGSVEWGVVSGFDFTGSVICEASPSGICIGGSGQPPSPPVLPSSSYDLGTWSFDAAGDYTGSVFVYRTTNGGLNNERYALRGAFHGESLPGLPLFGMVSLGLGLGMAGSRALRR